MTTTPPTTPPGLDTLTERAPSPIDTIAEAYMAQYATLDPLAATNMGIAGHDHEMTDHSPAGHEARAELTRSTLQALDGAAATDEIDQITLAAMRRRRVSLGRSMRHTNTLPSQFHGQ